MSGADGPPTGQRFHVLDVFATRRYAGNQLAVVEDAVDLDRERMQQVAAEFDFSETTFVGAAPVVGEDDGDAVTVEVGGRVVEVAEGTLL